MRENSKKEKKNRRVFARFTGLLIALAMFASSFAMLEGVVNVSAATTTTVTIGEVTINGTVGTPLKEQTFEITIENGKLDPVALYVGKDISDYCTQWDFRTGNRSQIYFFREDSNTDEGSGSKEDSLYKIYYYKPVGVKVTVAECTDTKLTCMVSGTPLTPSSSNLYVYLTPEMFAECTQRVDNSCSSLTPATSGKWNIASQDGSTSKASVSISCDQKSIDGQAGVTELSTTFTITLKNAIFARDMEKGTDVSVWFSGIYGQNGLSNNLPVDVAAVLTADVHVGDTSCTAKLTGVPRYGCYNYLAPSIPAQYVIGAGKDSAAFWRNKILICTSNIKFNIKNLEGEEPFMVANSADVYVYPRNYTADDSTFSGSNNPAAPRVQLELYKGYFSCTNSNLTTTIKALENYWLYSNTSGSLDKNAVGFLYSAGGAEGAEGHLEIGNFKAAGNSVSELSSQKKFYIAIKGTPYNVGEYPLSFFVPKNLLVDRSEEDGYTSVVVDKNASKQGKLVVMKPLQLEVDDARLEYKKGDVVDTYITVKTSVYSTHIMKSVSNLNTGNLKYTVTDEFKALGLNMEPVKVTPRSVVFHVTGTIAVKDADFALENAVTLSYENFDYPANSAPERFGEIAINSNPDAKIVVSSGGYGKAGQEIDYSDRDPVKIYAVDQKTKVVTGGAIVLSGDTPTLETDVDYKCYSTDGGEKWKDASKKKLTDKQFAALVNKGVEFQIADKYDKSAKGPA
ncbi:MAG: hypothetical protein IKN35_01835, partial [Lachnospiraceae bacterium]|nr:hypothetical protein [Lachnospiraceae bacterium]